MPIVVLPDIELVAVTWARADPHIAAIVEGRVATKLPSADRLTFPFLRVFRVATATPVNEETPRDIALLQWDAFGEGSLDGKQDFRSSSQLARTLKAKLETLNGYTDVSPATRRVVLPESAIAEGDTTEAIIDGVQVSSGPDRRPEPSTGYARFQVDALMSIRAG